MKKIAVVLCLFSVALCGMLFFSCPSPISRSEPVFTVSFDSREGDYVPPPIKGVVNGSNIAEPNTDPKKAGFNFGGWYKDTAYQDDWDFNADKVVSNITLYAQWEELPVRYTVAFESFGGSPRSAIGNIMPRETIAQPSDPEKAHPNELYGKSIFGGWYKEAGYQNIWDFNVDKVNANVTLYAKWEPRVHIAGISNNKAILWADDVKTVLTEEGDYSEVSSVVVNGTDVFTVGFIDRDAFLWKNSERILLPKNGGSDSSAYEVTVFGDDVYIVGYIDKDAVLWKNNRNETEWHEDTIQYLTKGSPGPTSAQSVVVFEGDVYVAGYRFGRNAMAKVWKNGEPYLESAHGATGVELMSVFVSREGTVYVSGRDNQDRAVYWENNTEIILPSDENAFALAITVVEGTVYAVGYDGKKAVYWKNGKKVVLDSTYGLAYAVTLVGGDMYISGNDENDAVVWKNDTRIKLTDGSEYAEAFSIFVRQ